MVDQLSKAAGALRQKDPKLFETIIQEMEREEGTLPEVWKLLEGKPAIDIFRRESLLPSVLKEAFERLLGDREVEKEMASLFSPGDFQRPPGTSGLTARHGEMMETLRDYAALQKNIHSLKRRDASPPRTSRNGNPSMSGT